MKKILITIDYADNANSIAQIGYLLAKNLQAKIYLLHIINEPNYYSATEYSPVLGFTGYMDVGVYQSGILDGIKKGSYDYLNSIKSDLHDDEINTIVAEGNIADTILSTAKNIGADLIVIGTHSRSWLSQVVLGSVAKEVLDNTSIPLFIIPTKKNSN
jgi:nucleotide-binding universal stress UspA family protein